MSAEMIEQAVGLLRAKKAWKDNWSLSCRELRGVVLFRVIRPHATSLRYQAVLDGDVVKDLVGITTSQRKRIMRGASKRRGGKQDPPPAGAG